MILFETIKQINQYDQEYWSARDLYKSLEYTEYGKFLPTINKAKTACQKSEQEISMHFADVSEPQKSRNQYAETLWQIIDDIHLSRYACYLIAMEADSRKETVSLAKTYFAIQTRKQELTDQYLEDQKRIYLRDQMTEHNKSLAKTADEAKVWNYGAFTDYGYLGLYGMRNKEILTHKGLEPKDKLLDNIWSEELAANLFRATQAEAKIKREGVVGQNNASKAHFEVGQEVRDTIKKLWWTMPEALPITDNIKEAKKRITHQYELTDDAIGIVEEEKK
jgi:DNA-damage-inducible protein D